MQRGLVNKTGAAEPLRKLLEAGTEPQNVQGRLSRGLQGKAYLGLDLGPYKKAEEQARRAQYPCGSSGIDHEPKGVAQMPYRSRMK